MKTDFSKVLFTDEMRVTLDGPHGCSNGWVLYGRALQQRLRRQQGCGGIRVWAGIIGGTLVGPCRVSESVRITSNAYITFTKEHLEPWLEKQRLAFIRTIVLVQDNAPSHAARKNYKECLQQVGISDLRMMEWLANSLNLNPLENLWSIIKRRLH